MRDDAGMSLEQQRRDEDIRAQHHAAVAAGEQRVLMRTNQGELHRAPGEARAARAGPARPQLGAERRLRLTTAIMGSRPILRNPA
jgi:hypothetical protein